MNKTSLIVIEVCGSCKVTGIFITVIGIRYLCELWWIVPYVCCSCTRTGKFAQDFLCRIVFSEGIHKGRVNIAVLSILCVNIQLQSHFFIFTFLLLFIYKLNYFDLFLICSLYAHPKFHCKLKGPSAVFRVQFVFKNESQLLKNKHELFYTNSDL